MHADAHTDFQPAKGAGTVDTYIYILHKFTQVDPFINACKLFITYIKQHDLLNLRKLTAARFSQLLFKYCSYKHQ